MTAGIGTNTHRQTSMTASLLAMRPGGSDRPAPPPPRDLDALGASVEALPPGHPARADRAQAFVGLVLGAVRGAGPRPGSDTQRALLPAVRRAVRLLSQEDSLARAMLLYQQSAMACDLGQVDGDASLVSESVTAARAGLAGSPGPLTTPLLDSLVDALLAQFELTGASRPLAEEAEAAARRAMDMRAPATPAHTAASLQLANVLFNRHRLLGESERLVEAADLYRRALRESGAPALIHARATHGLATTLWASYTLTGDITALDDAETAFRKLATTTADTDPSRVTYLSHLCVALRARYERSGQLASLDEAIRHGTAAFHAAGRHHPERSSVANHLGLALLARFHRHQDAARIATLVGRPPEQSPAALLVAAVGTFRIAVADTPPGRADRPTFLANLAIALSAQADLTGSADVRDEAAAAGREAVTLAVAGHHELPRWLANLSAIEDAIADHGGGESHRTAALTAARQAMALARPGHPERAGYLLNLVGILQRAADEAGGDLALVAEAAARSQDAVEAAPTPLLRARAGHRLGLLEHRLGHHAAAATAFAAAVGELPAVLAADSDYHDQEYQTEAVRTLARDAAACAIDRGNAPAAVELLEAGCGFVLRRATGRPWSTVAPDRRTTRAHGSIILLNCSDLRCDALVIDHEGVRVEELPGVTAREVATRALRLQTAVQSLAGSSVRRPDQEDAVRETLAWLWDAVAEPALAGITPAGPGATPPRVWWVPTGQFSLLPLHAAGHHAAQDPAGRTVIDRVVSSYSASAGLLVDPGPVHADLPSPERMMIVALETTPGQHDLPGARAEATVVAELVSPADTFMDGDATRAAVLAALGTHRWAHFACHGDSGVVNPSGGRLLLADHESHPLGVLDIARLQLHAVEFVYLSACSTARAVFVRSDETLHVTAAFHLAGCRNVIGTLWPVQDRLSVQVAADVYDSMTSGGPLDPDRAAGALHTALLSERRARPEKPWIWAPYIHVGG